MGIEKENEREKHHCRTLIRSCILTRIPTRIILYTGMRNMLLALPPVLLLLAILVDIQVTRTPILTRIMDMHIIRIFILPTHSPLLLRVRTLATLLLLQRRDRDLVRICRVLRGQLLRCRLLFRCQDRSGSGRGSRLVLHLRHLQGLLEETEIERGIETETMECRRLDRLPRKHRINIGFIRSL